MSEVKKYTLVDFEPYHPPDISPKHADITVYRCETGSDGKPALPENVELAGIDTDVSSAIAAENIPKIISTFVHESVYSPIRLATELGWEPTPRGYTPPKSLALDGTSPLDAAYTPGITDHKPIFGWLDAFEDLMRVNSGLELSDLDKRHAQVQHAWRLFHVGYPMPSNSDHNRLRQVRNVVFHMNMWVNHLWYPWFPPLLRDGRTAPATLEGWIKMRKLEAQKKPTGPLDEWKRQHQRLNQLSSMPMPDIVAAHNQRGSSKELEEHTVGDKDGTKLFKALALALPVLDYVLRGPDREDNGEPQEQAKAGKHCSDLPLTKQAWKDLPSTKQEWQDRFPSPDGQNHPSLSGILFLVHMYTKYPLGCARDVHLLMDQGRFLKLENRRVGNQDYEADFTESHVRDYLGTVHRRFSIFLRDKKDPHKPAYHYLCEHFSTKKKTLEEGEAEWQKKMERNDPKILEMMARFWEERN